MGLAERLRAETRELHTATERAGVMPALLRGRITRHGYCLLLRNLHAIYAALEPALVRHAAHPQVGPIVFAALFRRAALADDLTALYGSTWADDLALKPAAQHYAQRLHALDATAPTLLVAHAYVRSLGDLSGGQVLRRIVAESLGLRMDGGAGMGFYDFGPAADVGRHLVAFRAGLNALPVDAQTATAIVAEARTAFERHAQLFVQIGRIAPAAPVDA